MPSEGDRRDAVRDIEVVERVGVAHRLIHHGYLIQVGPPLGVGRADGGFVTFHFGLEEFYLWFYYSLPDLFQVGWTHFSLGHRLLGYFDPSRMLESHDGLLEKPLLAFEPLGTRALRF